MAQRSRKRGRRERPAEGTPTSQRAAPGAGAAVAGTSVSTAPAKPPEGDTRPGSRAIPGGGATPGARATPGAHATSGAHATAGGRPTARAGATPASTAARRSRSEARNEAVRATLTPYAEGERPWPITVSAIVAAALGAFNLGSFLVGARLRVDGQKPGTAAVLLFALVMFGCAGGMWRMRYWAVFGFQVLLVLVLLTFAVLLIKVSNLAGLAVCLGGLSVGGVLFYKLVRAMSRMQAPAREPR